MTTPLERARKFVELACSDNENEARNSAVKACRLIKEHDLLGARTQEGLVDQAARAAERVKGIAADPDVQKGVVALTDLFKAASSLRKPRR